MFEHFAIIIVLIDRLRSSRYWWLTTMITFLWQWHIKRLRFVINRATNYINTITLSRHDKIAWVSLKCIPYTSIVVLILWNNIGICECLELCLLISWVVTCSCHMPTCQVVVFICTWFYKMVVCWLELWLNGGLVEKCWSSWCVAMCNLFCYVFINGQWAFLWL